MQIGKDVYITTSIYDLRHELSSELNIVSDTKRTQIKSNPVINYPLLGKFTSLNAKLYEDR